MATLADIVSPVWTLNIDGAGAIAEGIDAIKQCISLILRTTPGTDPLRPTFGCNLSQYVDLPINQAIPKMKKAILDAIARWESRVTVSTITSSLGDSGQIVFNVGYTLVDGTIADSLIALVSGGGISTGVAAQRIILRAYYPTNGAGLQYQISGIVNGTAILPGPPVTGFASLGALYGWVQTNWINYGRWYLTGDSLVGYMNPGATSASLAITILSVGQITQIIPEGSNYTVAISIAGTVYSESGLHTLADILSYVENDPTLGTLGMWQIAYVPGDFSTDFGDDFDTEVAVLQLTGDDIEDVQITITTNAPDFNNN